MEAGELEMKERILLTRREYSVLKEVLKFHECGWYKAYPCISFTSHLSDGLVNKIHRVHDQLVSDPLTIIGDIVIPPNLNEVTSRCSNKILVVVYPIVENFLEDDLHHRRRR
jgi:hypothetical protein